MSKYKRQRNQILLVFYSSWLVCSSLFSMVFWSSWCPFLPANKHSSLKECQYRRQKNLILLVFWSSWLVCSSLFSMIFWSSWCPFLPANKHLSLKERQYRRQRNPIVWVFFVSVLTFAFIRVGLLGLCVHLCPRWSLVFFIFLCKITSIIKRTLLSETKEPHNNITFTLLVF